MLSVYFFIVLLSHDAMLEQHMLSSSCVHVCVYACVCLSITRQYFIKTYEVIEVRTITQ